MQDFTAAIQVLMDGYICYDKAVSLSHIPHWTDKDFTVKGAAAAAGAGLLKPATRTPQDMPGGSTEPIFCTITASNTKQASSTGI